MTEPPGSTGDPQATGDSPAQHPDAPPPGGYIPPRQQPAESPRDDDPPSGFPQDSVPQASALPDSAPPAGYPQGGATQGGYPEGGFAPGGPGQGGYPQGGFAPGGPGQGGYAQDGYPPGGFPQGGYPPGGFPQGGYPPPAYSPPPGPPPMGYASADDKTWALVAHFGGAAGMFLTLFFGWLAPLIILVSRGNQSPTVRAHAVAALNFQLTWTIVAAVGAITVCFLIGWFILVVAWLVGTVIGIIAGLRANDGQLYNYPLAFPLVK
jgi:hypothetical protein